MFCSNCGKQIPDGAKFCSICGVSQPQCTKNNHMSNKIPDPNLKSKPNSKVEVNNKNNGNKAQKKSGSIIITLIIIGLVVLTVAFLGFIGSVVSGIITPIETFPDPESREFTFNNTNDISINVRDDYTLNNYAGDTVNQAASGSSRIKEFSFDNEFCNNTYMYTYANGAFADWSDGDIITLSGSVLFDKSMNDNPEIPGYVDSYVEGLELLESINSEDVTVNITDNGDYVSASFTFSNLSGNTNSNYVNAVAKWFGVSTVGDAIKDSDLSACLENNGYTVKEY